MTTALSSTEVGIDILLPATRHIPAGFTGGWHCKAGSTFLIRNLLATNIATLTHDCWTLEPAPTDVNESKWTTLTIGLKPEGGAVFYRGPIIDRFVPSSDPNDLRLHFMERSSPSDYEGMETDRHPPRIEHGSMIRYLGDGSVTRVDHLP